MEKLEDPVAPVAEIVARCEPKQLMRIYKIAAFEGADGFLQAVAAARGKLGKGGIPDTTAAARIVLQVGSRVQVSTVALFLFFFFLRFCVLGGGGGA